MSSEDHDVECQMFFDFKEAPNVKATLKAVDVYGNESTVVKDLNL